jgi:hypothetical protein
MRITGEHMEEKNHISWSQVNLGQKCTYQLKLYRETGPTPPNVYMWQGGRLHKAIELHYTDIIQGGKGYSTPDITDKFVELYENHVDKKGEPCEVIETDLTLQKGKDQGVKLLECYHTQVAPTVRPHEVEWEFNLDIAENGMLVNGYVDLIDKEGAVLDIKFDGSKRGITQAAVDNSIQLGIYDLASRGVRGEIPTKLGFQVIRKKRVPEPTVYYTKRKTAGQLQAIALILQGTMRTIQAEAYTPNPSGWWCSKKWCGWWDKCEYGKENL